MTPFLARATSIAERFLHTALVVDDEALSNSGPKVIVETAEPTAPAPRPRGVKTGLTPGHDKEAIASARLIDAFGDKGIVCSFLDPTVTTGDLPTRFLKMSAKADIIVLDWMMENKAGDLAKQLIADLITEDGSRVAPKRRLIAVYTGQPNLLEIVGELKDVAEKQLPDDQTTDHGDAHSFTRGPVAIVVFAKAHASPPTQSKAREVAVADLPTRLIEEYAARSKGLVSGVALRALGVLREDTHRLLHVLNSSLDLGYVGQRLALPSMEDSEEQLVDIVVGEIRSVLDDHRVGSEAGTDAVREWSDELGVVNPGGLIDGKLFSSEQYAELLRSGLGSDDAVDKVWGATSPTQVSKTHLQNKVKTRLAHVFAPSVTSAVRSANLYAERMLMRTYYGWPDRYLHLGVIVERRGEYLLCVQPLCDSVRLEQDSSTTVPFLGVTVGSVDSGGKYLIQLTEGADPVRASCKVTPSAIRMLDFVAGGSGTIECAKRSGNALGFKASNGYVYKWVGALKIDHARDLAVRLGQQFARLGVDEPENLRRS